MYKRVLVPLDNSEHASIAATHAIELGRAFSAELVGLHVFNASQHGRAFSRLEVGLPDRYQEEQRLQHQRMLHGDLIERSLRLISDSYVEDFVTHCRKAGVPATGKTVEGSNYACILEASGDGFDLIALGAHGLGKTRDDAIGSVCERVARSSTIDVLVSREAPPLHGGRILVAIDGSECADLALERALLLASTLDLAVTLVHCYDPFFHRVAFGKMAGVLGAEAASLFRVREQESLHDQIIDTGLTRVGERHLERAKLAAAQRGVSAHTIIAVGKPRDQILATAEAHHPALLVLGRTGSHALPAASIGSVAEQVLRLVRCNVLLVASPPVPSTGRESGHMEEAVRPHSPHPQAHLVVLRKTNPRAPSFLRHLAVSKLRGRTITTGEEVIAFLVERTDPDGKVRITDETRIEFI